MRTLRGVLVLLTVTTALGAVAGGTGLIMAGSELFGEDVLAQARIEVGYVAAGLLLILTVGVPHLVATVGLLRPSPSGSAWGWWAALVAGLVLAGWIVVQLLVIEARYVLQPIYLGIGLLEAALAGVTIVRRPPAAAGRAGRGRPELR